MHGKQAEKQADDRFDEWEAVFNAWAIIYQEPAQSPSQGVYRYERCVAFTFLAVRSPLEDLAHGRDGSRAGLRVL